MECRRIHEAKPAIGDGWLSQRKYPQLLRNRQSTGNGRRAKPSNKLSGGIALDEVRDDVRLLVDDPMSAVFDDLNNDVCASVLAQGLREPREQHFHGMVAAGLPAAAPVRPRDDLKEMAVHDLRKFIRFNDLLHAREGISHRC